MVIVIEEMESAIHANDLGKGINPLFSHPMENSWADWVL